MTRTARILTGAALLVAGIVPVQANGLGEGRPYQFRSDTQRQVMLTLERTRLELQGLLSTGASTGPGGGATTGQIGNQTIINVSGSNNNITVTQTNSGAQSQTSDCSNADFNITGGMYGC